MMCSWFYIGTHVQTCQCECVYECSQHMPDFIVIILSVFVFDQTCGSEEALKWIGGGGFFLACKDFFLRTYGHSFPAGTFFFFLKWRLAHAHVFRSLGQDQSTVAQ